MHLRFINGTRREGADHNEPSRITKLETIQKWWLCLPVYNHVYIFKRYWSNMIERLQVGKQSCCHRLPSGFEKRGLFYASTNKFWFKIKTDQQKHQWSLTLISKIALFQKSGFQTIIVSNYEVFLSYFQDVPTLDPRTNFDKRGLGKKLSREKWMWFYEKLIRQLCRGSFIELHWRTLHQILATFLFHDNLLATLPMFFFKVINVFSSCHPICDCPPKPYVADEKDEEPEVLCIRANWWFQAIKSQTYSSDFQSSPLRGQHEDVLTPPRG